MYGQVLKFKMKCIDLYPICSVDICVQAFSAHSDRRHVWLTQSVPELVSYLTLQICTFSRNVLALTRTRPVGVAWSSQYLFWTDYGLGWLCCCSFLKMHFVFSRVAVCMQCTVCVCVHSLSGLCLFVEKAVNSDNYSKQNAAPTTHNYATDANYCVSY